MQAFDRTGRMVVDRIGSEDHVTPTPSELRRMRHAVVTHNHPGGVLNGPELLGGDSFSETDIRTAAFCEVAEERVITARWRYSMRPPAGGWNLERWQHVLKPAYDSTWREVLAEVIPRMDKRELTREEGAALALHETWARVAKKIGMRYTRTRMEP